MSTDTTATTDVPFDVRRFIFDGRLLTGVELLRANDDDVVEELAEIPVGVRRCVGLDVIERVFDIGGVLAVNGVNYNEDVDLTVDDDGRPSWRIYTTSRQAHVAVRRLTAGAPVDLDDCSNTLDDVDRGDGGLYGCWILTARVPST